MPTKNATGVSTPTSRNHGYRLLDDFMPKRILASNSTTLYALDATTIDLCLSVRQHARHIAAGAWRFLCHGPGLSGLRAAVPVKSGIGLLRHSRQVQPSVPQGLLPSCGQAHRLTVRSNSEPHRFLYLSALTITERYRYRWQVELFFKWIKQHLRIKSFFGTSENAVRTQVWIAVSVYVLIAIIKKRLNIKASLYSILQIFSLTVFETIPTDQLLTGCDQNLKDHKTDNQLNLFD